MTHVADENRLLDLDEAEDFLRVSRSKLYTLMSSGELPFVKLGRSRRVRMAALMALIDEHTRQDPIAPR
jgi:excisionase family DNA binding protein